MGKKNLLDLGTGSKLFALFLLHQPCPVLFSVVRCLLPTTHGLPNDEITSDLSVNLGVTAHISYHAMAALALGHLHRDTPAASRKSYLVFACDIILADGIEVVAGLQ